MKQLKIPKKPPRDLTEIKTQINLTKGLYQYFVFGYFMMLGFLIPVVFILYHNLIEMDSMISPIALIVSFLVFESIGFLLLWTGVKKRRKRKQALQNGKVISAKVVGQGRAFVFWKSTRDYTVTVEWRDDNNKRIHHTLTSHSRTLHYALPVRSETTGVFDAESRTVFFPIEIGVELIVNDEKK